MGLRAYCCGRMFDLPCRVADSSGFVGISMVSREASNNVEWRDGSRWCGGWPSGKDKGKGQAVGGSGVMAR